MTKDQHLAAALSEWFKRYSNSQRRWQTPVGRVLKEELQSLGNWKNAERGDPKKGYRAMVAGAESGS